MASHRRAKAPSRARVTLVTAAAATGVVLSAQAAQAAPTPSTGQLKAQLDQLNNETDKAVQSYDQVQEQAQQLQQKVSVLQDEIAREQAKVNVLLEGVGTLAATQYANGSVDPTVQLLLSASPDDFLAKASTMDEVSQSQTDQLAQLQAEEKILDTEKAQAESELGRLDAMLQQAAAAKAAVMQKVAQTQKLLDSVTAAQRATLTGGGSQGSTTTPNLSGATPGDSIEMAAFAAAKTRIGLPYHWSYDGPDQFDCSGLMMWSYAQAGYQLGRDTYSQLTYGTPVTSVADLRVGDLVFFNGGEHVGMYAGNGYILHAPHTGAFVRFEPMATVGTIYAMRHI
ncbi:NlpC/P60 family protein [Streptacidiphilus sp. MAP5-3]|uniref:C40 family peptidase n=1 Tax=unclassified Streptacidiphilus TaxID=2643834 RepID=UPI0035174322